MRRLQSAISRWPVDSSRKGRDLGEFLRISYHHTFKEQARNDVGPPHYAIVFARDHLFSIASASRRGSEEPGATRQ